MSTISDASPPAGPRGLIDLHSHWFSPRAVELLSARGVAPRFVGGEDGRRHLHRAGPGTPHGRSEAFPLGPQWFDIDARLDHLDTHGIAHQLLSWPTTLGVDAALPAAETLPLWAAYNDDLAALVRRHPRRFSAVAALSSSDVAWSARELARAHAELGLIGGVLPVNGFASLAGAERFRPLFEVAQRNRSHLYLHTGYAHPSVPGQPPLHLHSDNADIRALLDTGWSFAAAAITLAFSDFLDAYPDVTVQIAMLGGAGTIALVAEQVALNAERLGVGAGADEVPARFRRLWFDTGAAGRGAEAIALAARVLGEDRIVFGTDYAPAPSVRPVIDQILQAPLQPAQRERIFSANARALLASRGVALAVA